MDQVVSEEQDKKEEKEHVRKVLKFNGCIEKRGMKIPSKKQKKTWTSARNKEYTHQASVFRTAKFQETWCVYIPQTNKLRDR